MGTVNEALKWVEIQASGRFLVAPNVLLHDSVIPAYEICDVYKITEIDNDKRAEMIRRPGFKSVYGDKGPRDDCGIAWRVSKFKVLFAETHTVTHKRYKNERGDLADTTEAAFAVLQDQFGNVVVEGIMHTDHGMQAQLRSGHINTDLAIAYVTMCAGYKARAEELATKYHARAISLSADWNINLKQMWARAWLRLHFRHYELNWSNHLPQDGTFGDELIDGTMMKGCHTKGFPKIRKRTKASDHREVETIMTWGKAA